MKKWNLSYAAAIERSLETTDILMEEGIFFLNMNYSEELLKHFLSPLKRISLNKQILELFLENFEQNQEIERIIHHAKNANEYNAVASYAPIAA